MKRNLLIIPILSFLTILFGTSLRAQQGETCAAPLIVAALPFTDAGNTSTYGDNYGTTDVPPLAANAVTDGTGSANYLTGDDVVYRITPSMNGSISVSTTNDDDWIGLWVFENCPFTSTIGYHTSISGATRSIPSIPVQAGVDYFIVISSWANPQSTNYTLEITGSPGLLTPPSCMFVNSLTLDNLTANDADISWTAGGSESAWNVSWGTPGYTPGDANEVGTSSVATNSYQITGLTPETDYEFYVQADCGGGDESIWIGPYSFTTPPTCPAPTDLAITNLTTTSADLGWTNGGSETAWNVEYGPAGFTPGTGTSVTTNPYSISGLTQNTDYDFYVQADCGGGDASTWVGPFSFTTPCGPLSIPFSENFASTSTTQNCWTVLDDNNDGDTWDMDYSYNSLSGDEVAAMYTDLNSGVNDDYLISPTLTLTGNERLRFHYRVQSAGEPNDFQVLLSTSGIGSSNFTDTIMPLKEADNTTYEEEIIYLHSFTGDVNIAFHVPAGGLDGWRLYIDSVVVETSPSCPEPTDLSIQNIDATTVDLTWTENGSATTWNVEYGPAGFTPGTGTSVTTNPYSISGLTPETDYDFYVQADCGSGDVSTLSGPYSFTTLPTCPTPFDIIVLNQMATAIEIGWTQQGSGATTWNIEYGEEGFVQGTGTVLTGITSNPYTVTGLNANTRYEFYVQADCGGNEQSDWSASSGSILTECLIYEANGFCEGFDIDNSPYIGCWRVRNSNLDGDIWQVSTANPNTGAYSAIFSPGFSNTGENDDYLITPELNMQGIEFMEFYYSVESATNPNGFQVLLSTSGSEVADFTDTLMHFNVYTNTNYLDTTIDLTGYTGTVYIAFHMPDSDPNADDMYIDDVCFGECIPTPVADFEKDLCRTDGTVNLMEDLYNFTNIYGEWIFPQNQASIEQDSLLNVDYVSSGSYDLTYIVQGLCQADTTIATINLYNASSAGRDSTITVCKEEPIDLFSGLGGTVDLGGTWIDYNNAPLSTSYPIAPQIPAQYNYYYVVANAACPADTALLVVNVDPTCTYVSVTEEEFEKISVHPNPATDLLNIVNPFNASALKVELLDMNGRVVLIENKALNNSTKASIAIDHLEKGVYTLRIYNQEGQKTFKVVKQ